MEQKRGNKMRSFWNFSLGSSKYTLIYGLNTHHSGPVTAICDSKALTGSISHTSTVLRNFCQTSPEFPLNVQEKMKTNVAP